MTRPKTYRRGATRLVREAARNLKAFKTIDVEDLCPTLTFHQIKGVLFEMSKTGEIRRVQPGQYEYAGKNKRRTFLDVVWHLVRSHRRFTTDEMERLSGAQRPTVLEYLHCLKHLGYLRHTPRSDGWQMINDPGPDTPVNTTKCQRLRRFRSTQKEE